MGYLSNLFGSSSTAVPSTLSPLRSWRQPRPYRRRPRPWKSRPWRRRGGTVGRAVPSVEAVRRSRRRRRRSSTTTPTKASATVDVSAGRLHASMGPAHALRGLVPRSHAPRLRDATRASASSRTAPRPQDHRSSSRLEFRPAPVPAACRLDARAGRGDGPEAVAASLAACVSMRGGRPRPRSSCIAAAPPMARRARRRLPGRCPAADPLLCDRYCSADRVLHRRLRARARRVRSPRLRHARREDGRPGRHARLGSCLRRVLLAGDEELGLGRHRGSPTRQPAPPPGRGRGGAGVKAIAERVAARCRAAAPATR